MRTIKYRQIVWLSLIPLVYINLQFLAVTYYSLTAKDPMMIIPMIPFIALTYYTNSTLLEEIVKKDTYDAHK